MTLRIFTYQDADAPQLTGQAGSLIGVLRKVLAEGYGTGEDEKASLDWEMMLDGDRNDEQAAFRSKDTDSTQRWLVLDDRGGPKTDHFGPPHGWGDARICYARGAHSFTGWDSNGVPQVGAMFPTAAQRDDEIPSDFHKSQSEDGTERPWLILGDERCFYLFTRGTYDADWHTSNINLYATAMYFFGDVVSFFEPAHKMCAIGGSHDNTNTSNNNWGHRAQWFTNHRNNFRGSYLDHGIQLASTSLRSFNTWMNSDGLSTNADDYGDIVTLADIPVVPVLKGPWIVPKYRLDGGTGGSTHYMARFPYFRHMDCDTDYNSFYDELFGADSLARTMVEIPGVGELFAIPVDGANSDRGLALFDLEER